MTVIEHRAIALGITEEAVDALVRDQSRPLMERVCDFAEGVIASQQAGAVGDLRELYEALEGVQMVGGRRGGKTQLNEAWKRARARLDGGQ